MPSIRTLRARKKQKRERAELARKHHADWRERVKEGKEKHIPRDQLHHRKERRRHWAKIRNAALDAIERIRKLIRKKQKADKDLCVSPGDPCWGGADVLLEEVVERVAARHGLQPNSAKRSACYGNCSSDHHISQLLASARDFPTANNYSLRDEIMRELGVGGPIHDYYAYYVTYRGVRFRIQPIAGTHGTGPHLHIGGRQA